MKKLLTNVTFYSLCLGLCLHSCSKDIDEPLPEPLNVVSAKSSFAKTVDFSVREPVIELPNDLLANDIPFDLAKAVEPSTCTTTPFDDVINRSISRSLDALGFEWFNFYAEMNFFYTLTDESRPYFGEKGQYTFLVYFLKWRLERFWKMRGEVSVRGQHNATLNDIDKITDILTFWYGFPEWEALDYADYFVNVVNVESTFLVETPLLSFDGFAIALDGLLDQGDIIVIGDGLIELMAQTGISKIAVISGILSHEWAHQIQFNNFEDWYPDGAADNAPEATRTTELEADFFTGYYLTHQRGGTHNWNSAAQFLDLFYNIGDCSFQDDNHHGTPNQRMEAAELGYDLGRKGYYNCSKNCKGHRINGKKHKHYFRLTSPLSANQVHTAFLDVLEDIVGGTSSPAIEEEEEEYYY